MDLSTAIRHAIDGHAVLFIGSGASVGAKPLIGDKFLTGRELAQHLSGLAGLSPPTDDLNFAAQRYRKSIGETKLVELLQGLFSVSEVTDLHRRFCDIPWNGIYTTNYDNVLERCYADRKKKLVPITPDQDRRDHTSRKSFALHINGYIDTLTADSLDNSFKLTNTSYLTEAFQKSNWSFVFRRNLETARAIIFIGYSMYDIDIQRIMYGGDALKSKTIFIERSGKTSAEIESSLQIDFGDVFPIGLEGFWREYDSVAATYTAQDDTDTYFAFEELRATTAIDPLRDDDVFSLLLSGTVRTDVVWSTVAGSISSPYFIVRDQIGTSIRAIESGARTLIATSDLANGKSLFCLGASCKLASLSYRVFWLNDDADNTGEELDRICQLPGKLVIVIENYTRRFDEIRHVQAKRGSDLLLILSAKSSLHEVYQEDLLEILDTRKTVEFDLNILSDVELTTLESILETYKFWGDRDALPARKKRQYLEHDCGRQLSAVLLDLVKSPAIQARFRGLFEAFRQKSELADVVVAASVLKLLGFNSPRESVVSEILDSNYLYSLEFKRNIVARELLSFGRGGIIPRSSIMARFGLTSFTDGRELVDRLIRIATNSHNRGESSDFYFGIYKDLVTFSILQSLLPENGKRDSLIRFYEGLRNLRAAKNHPHFWLQYAIARLASDRPEDLRMAKQFLDSAYAHAEKRKNYHTRHLDNVLARYWIQHAMTVSEINLAMLELADGHALIVKQARTEANDSPYKVARMYVAFYNAKRDSMSAHQKVLLRKMSTTVLELIPKLPEHIRAHSTVRFCCSELESLIADIPAA